MKILFDSLIFTNQKIGGVSRYHYELLSGLHCEGIKILLAGKFVRNLYIKTDIMLSKYFIFDFTCSLSLLNKVLVSIKLRGGDSYDIYHPTDTRDFLLKYLPANKPMVFTIHDMIPEKQPHVNPFSTLKYKFAKRANTIIAVSENTKKDIIELFGIPGDKIKVIYHGLSVLRESQKQPPGFYREKYILFVGGRNSYKNFSWFIKTIQSILSEFEDFSLVCAGGKPFSAVEREMIEDLNLENKVICITKLQDAELAYLYSNAKVFVFPSLYEGFGIPILEAWACKTPILLSNRSCFPEIATDGALFFDPESPESLQNTLRMVLNDSRLRQSLIQKGLVNLKKYSWESAVGQTIKVYQEILNI
jgi:glycosyltransferase involved in cell wall biosynthesis